MNKRLVKLAIITAFKVFRIDYTDEDLAELDTLLTKENLVSLADALADEGNDNDE